MLTMLEEHVAALRLHVERVERKERAAVKSSEAKTKRIEHLETLSHEQDAEIER
jgi:hypothetical protein